jgi:hypothetical protein
MPSRVSLDIETREVIRYLGSDDMPESHANTTNSSHRTKYKVLKK